MKTEESQIQEILDKYPFLEHLLQEWDLIDKCSNKFWNSPNEKKLLKFKIVRDILDKEL